MSRDRRGRSAPPDLGRKSLVELKGNIPSGRSFSLEKALQTMLDERKRDTETDKLKEFAAKTDLMSPIREDDEDEELAQIFQQIANTSPISAFAPTSVVRISSSKENIRS